MDNKEYQERINLAIEHIERYRDLIDDPHVHGINFNWDKLLLLLNEAKRRLGAEPIIQPFDMAIKEYMKIEDKTILSQMYFQCGICKEIKPVEELVVRTKEPTVETETSPQGDVKGMIIGGVGLFCRPCLTIGGSG